MIRAQRNQLIRLLTYFCLIAFVVVMARRYFMIRAGVEESVVRLNIRNIQLAWPFYYKVQLQKHPQQKDAEMVTNYLKEIGLHYQRISSKGALAPRQWGLLENPTELIYHVENKMFFKSKDNKPYIKLRFIYDKDNTVIQQNPYEFCELKAWWGCEAWSNKHKHKAGQN